MHALKEVTKYPAKLWRSMPIVWYVIDMKLSQYA
jgi:hypothetical protein